MAKNQKKITLASFNSLMEFSAIPRETRKEYLDSLLKRKNASTQKNVLLLKLIYKYVDESKIYLWNPESACATLGISMDALYMHKSRVLKSLRKYHISPNEKIIQHKNNDSVKQILDNADRLMNLGLLKEAKSYYLKAETVLQNFSYIPNKLILLSQVYENLVYCYYYRRRKKKILNYLSKFSDLINTAKSEKMAYSDRQLLLLRLNYCKYQYHLFDMYKNLNHQETDFYSQSIYDISKKSGNFLYLLRILYSKASVASSFNNLDKAGECIKEGCQVALKLNAATALYSFKSLKYYINLISRPKTVKLNNSEIISYYRKIKKAEPMNLWTLFLENSIVHAYYPEKRKDILEVYYEQINSSILRGDYLLSIYWRFIHDSELYNDKIIMHFNTEDIHKSGYLQLNKIDEELLSDIEKTFFNILCYQKVINDIGFLWDIYRLQLLAYFLTEDDFNFEQCQVVANKMERLKKHKERFPPLDTFDLLKLGIKMLEASDNLHQMLSRYEFRFKKMLDESKNNPHSINIMDYAIMSSLSRRLCSKEITAIVKDFYNWLQTHHPQILAPVFRELKEREAKIHLVEGKEAAA